MPKSKTLEVKAGESIKTVVTNYFTNKGLEPFRTFKFETLSSFNPPLTVKITVDYDAGGSQDGAIQYVMAKINVKEKTGNKTEATKTVQFNLPPATNAAGLNNLLANAGFE